LGRLSLRIGHTAGGVVGRGGVGVEGVEGEVDPPITEEVLLAPPVEHLVGDLGGGGAGQRGDDRRLVAVCLAAGDLAGGEGLSAPVDLLRKWFSISVQ
jgi:hypothetical protein